MTQINFWIFGVFMCEAVTKVIEAIKNDFDQYDVERNSCRRHYRRPAGAIDMSKCNDYCAYKYFTYDGQDYCVCFSYRLLDIEYQDIPIKAEHIEYRVQNTRSYPRGYSTKPEQVNSFEKFIDDFNSNSPEFKQFINDELVAAGFPADVRERIVAADLSKGFLHHVPFMGDKYDNLSLIDEFDPERYKDHYMVMFDKDWHQMDNYHQHDDCLADFLDTFDITLTDKPMKLTEWIAEYCHGKVTIYGNAYAWYMIIFEDKNDTMLYKMTWQ